MCIRRKQRNSKKKLNKKNQTKLKKKKRKRKCCLRCWSSICRWCCKRFGRCVRKKLLHTFEPPWDDYEFADIDLKSFKDKFSPHKERSSITKKSTIVTLYRNNKQFSKTNISLKHFALIEGLEADDLKKKFSIKGSKAKVLEEFVEDYKKGNLSSSGISNKFNPKKLKKLDRNQLDELLDTYIQKKLNKHKSWKSLKDVNFDDIKRRFSIRQSKEEVLDKLNVDYLKGNLEKSILSKIRKLQSNNLNKEKVSDVFRDLKQHQRKNKKLTSMTLSKFKEYNSLSKLKSVFENVIRK